MTETTSELILELADQFERGELYTPPSSKIGAFDLPRAYQLQRQYVANWQTRDTLAGFKAAVTAPAAQKGFGLPGPVTSVLFGRGKRNNGEVLPANSYRTLLIETELSYRLKETVSAPLANVAELQALVARCSPTFELADPGFGANKFTGEDLVATNIACGGFIEGDAIDLQKTDVDKIEVTLTQNGDVLHNAAAGTVMDGQWQALLWLINQTVEQGYTITPEHILLSGAIGAPYPGQPGHFEADYGSAGVLSFEVLA